MKGDPIWTEALASLYGAVSLTRYCLKRSIGNEETRAVFDTMDTVLPHCRAFAWAPDAATAVLLAAKTIPLSATLPATLLPEGVAEQFWYFDTPIPIATPDSGPGAWQESNNGDGGCDFEHIRAITLAPGPRHAGVLVTGFREFWYADNGPRFLAPHDLCAIPEGTLNDWLAQLRADHPNISDHSSRLALVRIAIAGCVWLRERIVTTSPGHVERHRRKQLAREYKDAPPLSSDVQIIALRRTASSAHQGSGDSVAWSCRWVVSGHWRQQPYKAGRRLRYILPYVKGPEDKPLKTPTTTVYAVKR